MIENTSQRDPLLNLLEAMSDGPSRYITNMEARGQRQFVASTMLPSEVLHGTEDDLTSIGVKLGPVDESDPMFREATLPDGWVKEASDHDMWSYVKDEHGRTRLRIFYKAAFYDRRAHVSVSTPYSYANEVMDGSATLILDDTWATREAMTEAVSKLRENAVENSRYQRDDDTYYTDQIARCDALLAELAQKES